MTWKKGFKPETEAAIMDALKVKPFRKILMDNNHFPQNFARALANEVYKRRDTRNEAMKIRNWINRRRTHLLDQIGAASPTAIAGEVEAMNKYCKLEKDCHPEFCEDPETVDDGAGPSNQDTKPVDITNTSVTLKYDTLRNV